MPEDLAVKLRKFPERVAAVVAQTFAVKGPAALKEGVGLSDDEAVSRILDLCYELDPQLIARNQNKRLTTLRRVS